MKKRLEILASLGFAVVLLVASFAVFAASDPTFVEPRFVEMIRTPNIAAILPQAIAQIANIQSVITTVTVVAPASSSPTSRPSPLLPLLSMSPAPTISDRALARATITYGTLPAVTLLPGKPGKKTALPKKPTPAVVPTPVPTPAPVQTSASAAGAATPLTAQSFLNATTISFREQPDGSFKALFTTVTGPGENIIWGLGDTSIGGSNGIPALSPSYTCNPEPNVPPAGANSEEPTFNVQTPYDCTITVTPTSGNDLRAQSKDFSFTTPAGQLSVTLPGSLGTLLHSNLNQGGFVFNNENTSPVTITGLVLDVSYTALNVTAGPLILRPLDPKTDASLGDFHMENFPTDPTTPYTHTGTGLQIPLSLTVGASQQKLLPLDVLGVDAMDISSVNPSMTITLRAITTDKGNAGPKISINAGQIFWTCIIPTTGYDPNATSGPFATGQACN